MKILVTGGAGFIGSHVANRFVEEGYKVAVMDNLSVGKKKWVPDQAKLFESDITDRGEVEKVLKSFKPDIVNHHAAHNDAMGSLESPVKDAETNIVGSINLLEAIREKDTGRIVYASSGGLSYGEPEEIPTTEEHIMKPSYPYGISKHSFEHYLELYCDLYGIDFVTLRYASVYGTRATGGVIKNFFEAVQKDKKPVIFGDGDQTRDFIHVKDVVKANLLAIEKGSGNYNIGTCKETSINELLELMHEVTGSSTEPKYRDRWLGDIDRCKLDYSKAEKDLGWSPNIKLREGLEKLANSKNI